MSLRNREDRLTDRQTGVKLKKPPTLKRSIQLSLIRNVEKDKTHMGRAIKQYLKIQLTLLEEFLNLHLSSFTPGNWNILK